jgi:hypothetical protein
MSGQNSLEATSGAVVAEGEPQPVARVFVCDGCSRSAAVHVFLLEPHWRAIAPRPDGTGVLCIYCMSERLERQGYGQGEAAGTNINGPLANRSFTP